MPCEDIADAAWFDCMVILTEILAKKTRTTIGPAFANKSEGRGGEEREGKGREGMGREGKGMNGRTNEMNE